MRNTGLPSRRRRPCRAAERRRSTRTVRPAYRCSPQPRWLRTVHRSPGKRVLLLLLRKVEGDIPSTPPTALQGSPIEPRLGRHRAADSSESAPRAEAYPRLYLRHESVLLRPPVFVAPLPKVGSSYPRPLDRLMRRRQNTGTNKADKVGSQQCHTGRSLCPSSLLGRTSVFCLKRRTLEARNRPPELLHCSQPQSHQGIRPVGHKSRGHSSCRKRWRVTGPVTEAGRNESGHHSPGAMATALLSDGAV